MIFLRISSENEKAIEKIAETLLKERLAIDLNVKRNIERWQTIDGTIQKTEVTLLTSKTKGLLFGKIDSLIKKAYREESIEIYSVPIIHMDWDEMKHLQSEVVEV